MKKDKFFSLITLASCLFFVTSCAPKAESESVSTAMSSAQIAETIVQTDTLFKERVDISKLREAIKLLAQARNPDARNFETEWRFAQYNFFLGKQTKDEKEAEKAFADGLQAGLIASKIEPNKPEGHFWYGANLGEQAKKSPVTVGIKAVVEIKTAMNKVIEIQPNYQGASAFDALGQIELATRLTGGDTKKAIEYLEKGIAIEKDNSYLRLHLAEAYFDADRDAEAKKQIDYLLKIKPAPEYVLEHQESVELAQKLLKTKF